MRLLFEMDMRDYFDCTRTFRRDSARSIIIRGNRVAMVRSLKYDYFKFPGGGIEEGESPKDAMIRETYEETGMTVIPESVREYGYVHRIQKSDTDAAECFIQDNFYYICQVRDAVGQQVLDDYESEESFALEVVDPHSAIRKNRRAFKSPHNHLMFEREARVLEMLIAKGFSR